MKSAGMVGVFLMFYPFSISVTAENGVTDLTPLVVTATRAPMPLTEIGSSVTVISAEDIERNQYRGIADALQDVPGLRVVQLGGLGSQTSVFTRGAESNHTLVLIDGLEASDPSTPGGLFDFAHLLLENVERIEVVRGPQSTLYGSDAIGGVINIITKQGVGPLTVTGRVEGGTLSTISESATVSGGTPLVNYAANIAHVDSDGQSITPVRLRTGGVDDDGYRNVTVSTRLGITPTPDSNIDLMLRYIDTNSELDVGSGEDPDSEQDTEQLFTRAEARASLFSGFWQPKFSVSYTSYVREDNNDRQDPLGESQDTTSRGDKLKFELQNDLQLADNNLATVGLETELEDTTNRGELIFGGPFGDFILTPNTDEDVRNNAVYLQDQFELYDRFFGTIGVRLDDHQSFDDEVTYRATGVYSHHETGTRLKGSYGTGFKAPTLFELFGLSVNNFGSAFRGNPELKPEKSRGWEIGFDQTLAGDRFSFGFTWFENKIDDLIDTVFLPSFDSTTINRDEANIEGAEAFIQAEPHEDVLLRLDYTYTDAEDQSNNQLLRRPRHLGHAQLQYRPTKKANVSLDVTYTGEQTDIDRVTGARVSQGGYVVADIAGGYEINKHASILFRVNNVLDRDYEAANGFQALGVEGFVGLRLTL